MEKLLFIYNAKSGTLNTFIDIGHKLFSPNTYPCSLCALTHDTFSENKKWTAFKTNADIELEFYHIDEFEKKFDVKNIDYPIVLNKDLETVISHSELNNLNSLEELITRLNTLITHLTS
ncbi:MAG: GTPase [bacterium]